MQNRDHWVDYAKGLGILLVVIGHVSRGAFHGGVPMDADVFKLVDSVIYSFHMPLFFFLSGIFFIPSLNKYGRRRLILDKMDTVFYPYVIWSLIQGVIEVFLSRYKTAKTSMVDVLSLLWQPRAQFWFLYVLLLIFIVMALCYRERRGIISWILPLALVGAWALRFHVAMPFPIDFLATYLIYFYIGTTTPRWLSQIQQHAGLASIFSALIFSTLAWVYHIKLGHVFSDPSLLALPLAVSGIGLVCSLSVMISKRAHQTTTWIKRIGIYSMPIYLMHILAGSGVRIVLSKFMYIDDATVHIVLGTVIGIALPLVVVRLTTTPPTNTLRYLFQPPHWLSLKARSGN